MKLRALDIHAYFKISKMMSITDLPGYDPDAFTLNLDTKAIAVSGINRLNAILERSYDDYAIGANKSLDKYTKSLFAMVESKLPKSKWDAAGIEVHIKPNDKSFKPTLKLVEPTTEHTLI